MKISHLRSLGLVGLLLALPVSAAAQAQPLGRRIPFQGRVQGVDTSKDLPVQVELLNSAGTVVYGPEALSVRADAQGNFVFLIGSSDPPLNTRSYDEATGKWSAVSNDKADLDEIPDVTLRELRVRLTVDGKVLSPAQQLVPAFHAASASTASSLQVGATIPPGTIKSDAIGDGQVQESDLQGGVVSESKLSPPLLDKVKGFESAVAALQASVASLQASVASITTYVKYGPPNTVPTDTWRWLVSLDSLPKGKYLLFGFVAGMPQFDSPVCEFHVATGGTVRQQRIGGSFFGMFGDFDVTSTSGRVVLRCRHSCGNCSVIATGSMIGIRTADLRAAGP